MTAFWDIVPCSLTDADWHFRGAYCLHHQANNDGGSIHLWRVSLLQQDYTVLYPTTLASSYSPSWQPESYDCSECFITLVLTACSYCIIIHCDMSTLILHSAIHFIIALCISWTWMNKALEEWLTELLVGKFLTQFVVFLLSTRYNDCLQKETSRSRDSTWINITQWLWCLCWELNSNNPAQCQIARLSRYTSWGYKRPTSLISHWECNATKDHRTGNSSHPYLWSPLALVCIFKIE
jgi:hypothetical protein